MLCDHRMIVGSPLRYTYDYQPCDDCPAGRSNSDLFRPYLREVCHTSDYYPFTTYVTNMADDMHVPPSLSPQLSDSEGSISSVDSPKQKCLKCCWRNCGIHFTTLDQLASHVGKVHGASGPAGLFYCGWEGCTRNDRAFNARYKMLVHVRTHTNEKPHQCYQCDKSFSRAENLKIHIRSHSGEKPYACPVPGCNKAYSNSSDRFKHTRTHQDDKPYQCKVAGCSKRYTDPSSLRKHVKTYKHYPNATQHSTNASLDQIHEPKMAADHIHNMDDDKYVDFKFKDNYTWSGLIGSRILPYAMEIDIDAPLDLSISRKT